MSDVITRGDFYSVNYFEYGEAFYGSKGDMRYRISRYPQKNVFFDRSADKNKDAFLECVLWKGPLAYAKTQEEKITEKFPFNEEGANQLVAWMNEMRQTRFA